MSQTISLTRSSQATQKHNFTLTLLDLCANLVSFFGAMLERPPARIPSRLVALCFLPLKLDASPDLGEAQTSRLKPTWIG